MSDKLTRLSPKANKIFAVNLGNELKAKFPEAKNDEERIEKIGVSSSSYYDYKKKGFPDYFPAEVAVMLGCTEDKLLKYNDDADIATIADLLLDVCFYTKWRRLGTCMVLLVTLLAVVVNSNYDTPIAIYDSGFILGTCMLLLGIFGFSDRKSKTRKAALLLAIVLLAISGIGLGIMCVNYYGDFFSNLI